MPPGINDMTSEEISIHVNLLIKSQAELVDTVKQMANQTLVSAERNLQDRRDMDRERIRIDDHNHRIKAIEDERLREEQGRKFIYKYWPVIMFIVLLIGVVGTKFAQSVATQIYKPVAVISTQREIYVEEDASPLS